MDIYFLFIVFSNLSSNNLIEIFTLDDCEIRNKCWKNALDKIYKKESQNLFKYIFNVNEFKKIIKNI